MSKQDRQAVAQGLSDVFGNDDLLGNVIQGDRGRRRPSQSPTASAPVADRPAVSGQASNSTDKHYDIMTNVPYDNMTDKLTNKQAIMQADKQASKQTDKQTDIPTPPLSKEKAKRRQVGVELLRARIEEGRQMASSPTMTVTLRLPINLNQWLDAYWRGAWPVKVRKQELVIEALRILFARRGRPGEQVVATELLPEDEP